MILLEAKDIPADLLEYFEPVETGARTSVLQVNTQPFPGSHFAVFPEKLVEPLILAGCPLTVCAACGAPYERVTEVERDGQSIVNARNAQDVAPHGLKFDPTRRLGPDVRDRRTTLGFRPTCTCGAGVDAGVVLDPFMGSGTTALVARRLGRHYLGCDVSAEYVAMARRRLAVPYTLPMFDRPASNE